MGLSLLWRRRLDQSNSKGCLQFVKRINSRYIRFPSQTRILTTPEKQEKQCAWELIKQKAEQTNKIGSKNWLHTQKGDTSQGAAAAAAAAAIDLDQT